MARRTLTCFCATYRFPHRAGSGQCSANSRKPQDLCDGCGLPAASVVRDFGIGPYEFWGRRGFHSDKRACSACCHEDLVPNALNEASWVVHHNRAEGASK